jgi:hypothetical protein
MSAEGGDLKSGFVRFEGDSISFELKWEPLKKPLLPAMIVDDFVNRLRSKERDLKVYLKSELSILKHGCHYSYFRSEKGDGYIISWSCPETGRVFLGYLSFPRNKLDQAKAIIENSLPSVVCHSTSNFRNWSFYGISFKAPIAYELSERKFLLGKITLALASIKVAYSIIADIAGILLECWSAANVKFKSDYTDPARWLDLNYKKDLSRRFGKIKVIESMPSRAGDHLVTMFSLQAKKGIRYRWNSYIRTYVWYCGDTNRMFALSFFRRVGKPSILPIRVDGSLSSELIDQTLSSFTCH